MRTRLMMALRRLRRRDPGGWWWPSDPVVPTLRGWPVEQERR